MNATVASNLARENDFEIEMSRLGASFGSTVLVGTENLEKKLTEFVVIFFCSFRAQINGPYSENMKINLTSLAKGDSRVKKDDYLHRMLRWLMLSDAIKNRVTSEGLRRDLQKAENKILVALRYLNEYVYEDQTETPTIRKVQNFLRVSNMNAAALVSGYSGKKNEEMTAQNLARENERAAAQKEHRRIRMTELNIATDEEYDEYERREADKAIRADAVRRLVDQMEAMSTVEGISLPDGVYVVHDGVVKQLVFKSVVDMSSAVATLANYS